MCWAAEARLIRLWYAGGMDTRLSRITIDPTVCHGKPCVRGLRYPVESLLELLSSGMTADEILADYEDLERDDLPAVLEYATRPARTRRLQWKNGSVQWKNGSEQFVVSADVSPPRA